MIHFSYAEALLFLTLEAHIDQQTPIKPLEQQVKPTIGRVVLFHPIPEVTKAALIAYVNSDTVVNLTVFDHSGASSGQTSVQLVAPGEPKPEFGMYCEWPPHQVGQAAKQPEPVLFPVERGTAEALVRIIQKIDNLIEREA